MKSSYATLAIGTIFIIAGNVYMKNVKKSSPADINKAMTSSLVMGIGVGALSIGILDTFIFKQ